MGCDIHLYTEIKMCNKTDGDKWVSADYWMENRWKWDVGKSQFRCRQVYGGRNYHLFGMLADVRNYDDSPVMPHDVGVPEDCNDLYREEVNIYGPDGHSHGYVTYDKLLAFFNTLGPVQVSGMVHEDQAKEYEETGTLPTNWCGWTNMDNHVELEWTAPATVFTGQFLEALKKHYTEILQEVFYMYPSQGDYVEKYESYKKDFRILFFFDN